VDGPSACHGSPVAGTSMIRRSESFFRSIGHKLIQVRKVNIHYSTIITTELIVVNLPLMLAEDR
jgi:hypothetical protein